MRIVCPLYLALFAPERGASISGPLYLSPRSPILGSFSDFFPTRPVGPHLCVHPNTFEPLQIELFLDFGGISSSSPQMRGRNPFPSDCFIVYSHIMYIGAHSAYSHAPNDRCKTFQFHESSFTRVILHFFRFQSLRTYCIQRTLSIWALHLTLKITTLPPPYIKLIERDAG